MLAGIDVELGEIRFLLTNTLAGVSDCVREVFLCLRLLGEVSLHRFLTADSR
jgi:hypothetical protein